MKSLSHVRLGDPMDCSLQCSSIHGIFQARVLEWVAISFCRGSSQPRDRTWVSCNVGRCFAIWAAINIKYVWVGRWMDRWMIGKLTGFGVWVHVVMVGVNSPGGVLWYLCPCCWISDSQCHLSCPGAQVYIGADSSGDEAPWNHEKITQMW